MAATGGVVVAVDVVVVVVVVVVVLVVIAMLLVGVIRYSAEGQAIVGCAVVGLRATRKTSGRANPIGSAKHARKLANLLARDANKCDGTERKRKSCACFRRKLTWLLIYRCF